MEDSIQSESTTKSITVGEGANKNVGNVQIKESVKDYVFPLAKFLRKEDLPYKGKKYKSSWCQRMAQWCNIPPEQIEIWWIPTQKMIMSELAHQCSTKTNMIKKEFFSTCSNDSPVVICCI